LIIKAAKAFENDVGNETAKRTTEIALQHELHSDLDLQRNA
jgi:hypothetical protein